MAMKSYTSVTSSPFLSVVFGFQFTDSVHNQKTIQTYLRQLISNASFLGRCVLIVKPVIDVRIDFDCGEAEDQEVTLKFRIHGEEQHFYLRSRNTLLPLSINQMFVTKLYCVNFENLENTTTCSLAFFGND